MVMMMMMMMMVVVLNGLLSSTAYNSIAVPPRPNVTIEH